MCGQITVAVATQADLPSTRHGKIYKMGHETELFLSYYDDGMSVMSGGIDSGFRKVATEEYKPRLCPAILLQAAEAGHEAAVRKLLHAKASADPSLPPGLAGAAPLLAAAHGGHCAIAQLLLAAAAEIDRPDMSGATPLLLAAAGGHLEVVELLLACASRPCMCMRVCTSIRRPCN